MTVDATAPHGRKTQTEPAVPEIDVLWITAGLGCDGDTIAMTAATQPAIEDVLLGAIPGLPRVRLHNPVLAYRNGDDFLEPFHRAAAGRLGPFLLVVEGSIPNERNKAEGYWAALGADPATGQPILTCDWIDRLAPPLGGRGGRHMRRLRRHPRHGGEPDRRHGAGRYCPSVALLAAPPAVACQRTASGHVWMASAASCGVAGTSGGLIPYPSGPG